VSPCDTAHIARNEGLRGAVIAKYLALNKVPFLAFLFTTFPALRDRALQDPRFLFKLGVEVYGRVRCHPECSLIVDSFTRSLVHSFTRSLVHSFTRTSSSDAAAASVRARALRSFHLTSCHSL
jgi:hypothetical protein